MRQVWVIFDDTFAGSPVRVAKKYDDLNCGIHEEPEVYVPRAELDKVCLMFANAQAQLEHVQALRRAPVSVATTHGWSGSPRKAFDVARCVWGQKAADRIFRMHDPHMPWTDCAEQHEPTCENITKTPKQKVEP